MTTLPNKSLICDSCGRPGTRRGEESRFTSIRQKPAGRLICDSRPNFNKGQYEGVTFHFNPARPGEPAETVLFKVVCVSG